jgi:signal transduction histidine kinase
MPTPTPPGSPISALYYAAVSTNREILLPHLLHDLAGQLNGLHVNVALLCDMLSLDTTDESRTSSVRERVTITRARADAFAAAFREFADLVRPLGPDSPEGAPPVSLPTLIRRCIAWVRPYAKKRGVTVEATPEPHSDAVLMGSLGLLSELVIDILIDAFDVAPRGGQVILRTEARSPRRIQIETQGSADSATDAPRTTIAGFRRAALDATDATLRIDEEDSGRLRLWILDLGEPPSTAPAP